MFLSVRISAGLATPAPPLRKFRQLRTPPKQLSDNASNCRTMLKNASTFTANQLKKKSFAKSDTV
jgi:hypothetical protein